RVLALTEREAAFEVIVCHLEALQRRGAGGDGQTMSQVGERGEQILDLELVGGSIEVARQYPLAVALGNLHVHGRAAARGALEQQPVGAVRGGADQWGLRRYGGQRIAAH